MKVYKLIYSLENKNEKIKILDNSFIKTNKNKSILIINNKRCPLANILDSKYMNTDTIKIKIELNNVANKCNMFYDCNSLLSFSEIIYENDDNSLIMDNELEYVDYSDKSFEATTFTITEKTNSQEMTEGLTLNEFVDYNDKPFEPTTFTITEKPNFPEITEELTLNELSEIKQDKNNE